MKFAKRLQRKQEGPGEESPSDLLEHEPFDPDAPEVETPAAEDPARL